MLRADTSELRVALSAPAVGTAIIALPLFFLSNLGVGMSTAAPPVAAVLGVASAAALVVRKPTLPPAVVPVVLLALASIGILAYPMFEFGFDWLANANGDMAYYVLAATHLAEHGLQSPIDYAALADNRGFATSAQKLHLEGLRSGTQIVLSAQAKLLGRPPVAIYMPMAVAINMTCVCAVGALAMQASRKWWAAALAAALFIAAPMAAYGLVQQLMPQVWGITLAVALFAWLMRVEVHTQRATLADLAVVGVLTAAVFVVYFEVAATLTLAYGLYVALLLVRRNVSLRSIALLWGVPIALTAIVVNTFLPRALGYILRAITFGVTAALEGVPLFGYAVVPTALPGALGLQEIFSPPQTRFMDIWIVVGAALFLALIVIALVAARRGAAAAVAFLGDIAVGIMVARNGNDFGLFKLYMYVQPFVTTTVAVWLAGLRSRVAVTGGLVAVAAVVVVQLFTVQAYVEASRNPIDLPNASAADILPKFRRLLEDAEAPVVTVTDNYVLGPLQGAAAGDRRLYFVSRNFFNQPWALRTFSLGTNRDDANEFRENVDASRVLGSGRCVLSVPSGSQYALNRRSLPEGSPNLVRETCATAKNILVFVESDLGQASTVPLDRTAVSFWQLERDPSFGGKTFSGFGRYALFRVVGGTPPYRLALRYTTSSIQSDGNRHRLPPAAVIGSERATFPVSGSGSATVFSPPLQPRMIAGQPYLLLDMGRNGAFPDVPRTRITALWGDSVRLDPRVLTSYVRDVSLLSEETYADLDAPRAIRRIPMDLANPNLEYSGIYEDGWIGDESYAQLAGGPESRLVVRADVLPTPEEQTLEVRLNGRPLARRTVDPGLLDLRVPLPAAEGRRKLELLWSRTSRLRPPDNRPAVAHLKYLGVGEPPRSIRSFPRDLHDAGLVHDGILDDGWLERNSFAVLAGGDAGTLVVRAEVPPRPGGQQLRVFVDGALVATRPAAPGVLELRVPVDGSRTSRRVELEWSGTVSLAPPDTRDAAAHLAFLGVVDPPQEIRRFPHDLERPGLVATGIFDDGWLARRATAVLAGGRRAELVVQAQVPHDRQRLTVLVDGRRIASRAAPTGELHLRLPLAAANGSRRIELVWSRTARLRPPDTRRAAARLEALAIVRRE